MKMVLRFVCVAQYAIAVCGIRCFVPFLCQKDPESSGADEVIGRDSETVTTIRSNSNRSSRNYGGIFLKAITDYGIEIDERRCNACNELLVKDARFCHACGKAVIQAVDESQDYESSLPSRMSYERKEIHFLQQDSGWKGDGEVWPRNKDGILSVPQSNSGNLPVAVSSQTSSPPITPNDRDQLSPNTSNVGNGSSASIDMGRVGNYIIEKLLGKGGFGKVHRVRLADSNTDEKFAMKEMIKISEHDRDLQEAELLKQLQHEHIIKYVDMFIDSDTDIFYIILELANRGDLDTHIQNQIETKQQWNKWIIADCFSQIVSGLNYLHSYRSDGKSGVVHRDVKPKNILVCSPPNSRTLIFKIADFGLAKVMDESKESMRTFAGTKVYMSPEAVNGEPYSVPTDIWGLGCILYELCTLKRAFARPADVLQLKLDISNLPVAIPSISNPQAENWQHWKALSQICSDILVPDPELRPSCRDLMQRMAEVRLPVWVDVHNLRSRNENDETPLMRAITERDLPTIKALVELEEHDIGVNLLTPEASLENPESKGWPILHDVACNYQMKGKKLKVLLPKPNHGFLEFEWRSSNKANLLGDVPAIELKPFHDNYIQNCLGKVCTVLDVYKQEMNMDTEEQNENSMPTDKWWVQFLDDQAVVAFPGSMLEMQMQPGCTVRIAQMDDELLRNQWTLNTDELIGKVLEQTVTAGVWRVGFRPTDFGAVVPVHDAQDEINELQAEEQRAVQDKNYLKAHEIQEQIKKLQSQDCSAAQVDITQEQDDSMVHMEINEHHMEIISDGVLRLGIVKALLKRPELELDRKYPLEWSVLQGAVCMNDVELVSTFLKERTDLNPNLPDQRTWTAFQYAIANNNVDIVDAFLEREDLHVSVPSGVNNQTASFSNVDAEPPLFFAIRQNDAGMVNTLLTKTGVDVNLQLDDTSSWFVVTRDELDTARSYFHDHGVGMIFKGVARHGFSVVKTLLEDKCSEKHRQKITERFEHFFKDQVMSMISEEFEKALNESSSEQQVDDDGYFGGVGNLLAPMLAEVNLYSDHGEQLRQFNLSPLSACERFELNELEHFGEGKPKWQEAEQNKKAFDKVLNEVAVEKKEKVLQALHQGLGNLLNQSFDESTANSNEENKLMIKDFGDAKWIFAVREKYLDDLLKHEPDEEFMLGVKRGLANRENPWYESRRKPMCGYSALHFAVDANCIGIVKLLLGNPDIDVNLKDADGNSALHLAVRNVNYEMVKVLIEWNDNVKALILADTQQTLRPKSLEHKSSLLAVGQGKLIDVARKSIGRRGSASEQPVVDKSCIDVNLENKHGRTALNEALNVRKALDFICKFNGSFLANAAIQNEMDNILELLRSHDAKEGQSFLKESPSRRSSVKDQSNRRGPQEDVDASRASWRGSLIKNKSSSGSYLNIFGSGNAIGSGRQSNGDGFFDWFSMQHVDEDVQDDIEEQDHDGIEEQAISGKFQADEIIDDYVK